VGVFLCASGGAAGGLNCTELFASDLGASDVFNPAGSFSLAVWANTSDFVNNWGHVINRPLSQGEALGLAGRTEPIFKEF